MSSPNDSKHIMFGVFNCFGITMFVPCTNWAQWSHKGSKGLHCCERARQDCVRTVLRKGASIHVPEEERPLLAARRGLICVTCAFSKSFGLLPSSPYAYPSPGPFLGDCLLPSVFTHLSCGVIRADACSVFCPQCSTALAVSLLRTPSWAASVLG